MLSGRNGMSKEEDEWEVCELYWKNCRTTLSIHKLCQYRNTYCLNCETAHMWQRVDPSVYMERIKKG